MKIMKLWNEKIAQWNKKLAQKLEDDSLKAADNLLLAAENGDVEALKKAFKKADMKSSVSGAYALISACSGEQPECIAFLLDAGVPLDTSAIVKYNSPAKAAAKKGNEKIIEQLCAHAQKTGEPLPQPLADARKKIEDQRRQEKEALAREALNDEIRNASTLQRTTPVQKPLTLRKTRLKP